MGFDCVVFKKKRFFDCMDCSGLWWSFIVWVLVGDGSISDGVLGDEVLLGWFEI